MPINPEGEGTFRFLGGDLVREKRGVVDFDLQGSSKSVDMHKP